MLHSWRQAAQVKVGPVLHLPVGQHPRPADHHHRLQARPVGRDLAQGQGRHHPHVAHLVATVAVVPRMLMAHADAGEAIGLGRIEEPADPQVELFPIGLQRDDVLRLAVEDLLGGLVGGVARVGTGRPGGWRSVACFAWASDQYLRWRDA